MEKINMALDDIIKKQESKSGKGRSKRGGKGEQIWRPARGDAQIGAPRPAPYDQAERPPLRQKGGGKGNKGGGKSGSKESGKDGGSEGRAWKEGSKDGSGGGSFGFKHCKVGDQSEIHSTAGYIAASCRGRCPMSVLTFSGADGVNQAVKSFALARSYLEYEGLDLTVQAFEPSVESDGRDAEVDFGFTVVGDGWVRHEISRSSKRDATMELYVASESDPSRVAGSIAKFTREGSKHVCVSARGPKAVCAAAKSILLAQSYLKEESYELCFAPAFSSSPDGASTLRMHLFSGFSTCKVHAESEVHQAAGYISAGVRSGTPPAVEATGAESVNQAMKALALSRSYLDKDRLDFVVQPVFPEYGNSSNSALTKFELSLVQGKTIRTEITSQLNKKSSQQIYISSSSEPQKVAGAIAQSARDKGGIYCTAMGPQAIFRAAKSIFLARSYLRDEEVDLSMAPVFGKSEDGASRMHLHIFFSYMVNKYNNVTTYSKPIGAY